MNSVPGVITFESAVSGFSVENNFLPSDSNSSLNLSSSAAWGMHRVGIYMLNRATVILANNNKILLTASAASFAALKRRERC